MTLGDVISIENSVFLEFFSCFCALSEYSQKLLILTLIH